MKKIKFLAFSTFLITVLIVPALGLAQTEQAELTIKPGLLPTSPLYFLKEASRNIQLFFTFNPEKKAELKLKIADEKLIEAKIVSEKQPENKVALEKALANYEANRTELKARLEKLQETSKNPNIGTIIQKIDEKIEAHTELFNQLIIKTGKEPDAYLVLNMHLGILKAAGPSVQMWGTHILEVTTKKGDLRVDRVQAIDDEVLNQLRKYEGQKVIIRGEGKYYDLEGGFWGIVAEKVMTPGISSDTSGSIKIISPTSGDKWQAGKTYQIKWTGGDSGTSVWIFIPTVDGKNRTIAPIKTPNNGLFSWSIPSDFPIGKYKMQFEFFGTSENVLRVESGVFEIVSSDQSFGEKIIKKVGEREGACSIQKINPASVDCAWYVAAAAVPPGGIPPIPKTIYIGDDVGYACMGVSEKLTSIDFSSQTVTFIKIVGEPPLGGCPI